MSTTTPSPFDSTSYPPLKTGDPGSWARFTLDARFPAIVQQIVDNAQGEGDKGWVKAALQDAGFQDLDTLLDYTIHELPEDGGDDVVQWNTLLRQQNLVGCSLADAGFFVAEAYLYRRMAQALQWYTKGWDYFASQKYESLERALPAWISFAPYAFQHSSPGEEVDKSGRDRMSETLRTLLYFQLWGNLADLSLKPGQEKTVGPEAILGDKQGSILCDDWRPTVKLLQEVLTGPEVSKGARTQGQVHFVLDNTGMEICSDLTMACYILASASVEQRRVEVVLHCKAQPTFVSDALERDVWHTLHRARELGDPHLQRLATYLLQAAEGEHPRFRVTSHHFWNSGSMFDDLPTSLRTQFNMGDLVILKGDANYRRTTNDTYWRRTVLSPVQSMWRHMGLSVPVLAIRTLKSECCIGLDSSSLPPGVDMGEGRAPVPEGDKNDWLTKGRYGTIQLSTGGQ